uniref:Mucin-7-like n=1 Tax=Cicer arietinum TaxID=3827 RepID=A0A1S3DWK1_CICAR|nr:mucin-7-like [Cicer arietinum]
MTTPMHPSTSLEKDENGKSVSEKEYQGMIGSLLYLTASRPDIVFASADTHSSAPQNAFPLSKNSFHWAAMSSLFSFSFPLLKSENLFLSLSSLHLLFFVFSPKAALHFSLNTTLPIHLLHSQSSIYRTTMARTKQSAHKNASLCTPYSSSSSYESMERSPSPPPRPTPPHTSSASPHSNTYQEILNLNPLSTLLPPLYTRPTPNIAQMPPHLRTQTTPRRCSVRVQSGIGTSKPLNPKPHYIIILGSKTDDSSDSCPPSATTPPNNPTSTSEKAPTNTKPTTPSKYAFSSKPSQSTPPHQKRRLINEIVSPLTTQNEPPLNPNHKQNP